jgi:hypothetical protein
MSKNTDLGSLVNYIKGQVTGRLNAPAYTSATAFTGTIAGYLGFDTSGNILTSAGAGLTGSGTTNYIPKFTGSTSLGNSLIFDNGTGVAIGNTSPAQLLHISSSLPRMQVESITNTNNAGVQYKTRNSSGTIQSGGVYYVPGSTPYLLLTGDDNNAHLNITNAGNVGVGTTTPTNFIPFGFGAVVEASGGRGGGFISSNSSSTHKMTMSVDGTGNVGMLKTLTNHPLMFATNDIERMRIGTNGGVAVGTTSTSGYAMTVTNVDNTIYGPGSAYRIFARFVNNTTDNRGIGIGYNIEAAATYFSCLYSLGQAAQDANNGLALGVYSTTNANYIVKLYVNPKTVYMDLPSSTAGLTSGQLWRDGSGYVRQI